ncbi:hypothetical protein CRE_14513 [Caenorhabditis remanei]|uniref:C2H2-type domain-containing protein n=1 Tax=Caenorhabditis remanei TaxID=31234 RepID=E3M9A6_CAERE|nr:hypothetical protein CRE_14513 [Caenorhabditis remanei]
MAKSSKRHECKVCHKTFTRPFVLRRHEVVHTGEKPFECDFCGSRFSQNSSLNLHLRTIHAYEKPKSSHNTRRNLGRKAGKSAKAVKNKNRTASTPKTNKKQPKAVPKRSRQEAEDLEAMDDDNDSENSSGAPPEQQQEIDSESVISSNRDTGNNGNGDEVIDLFESNENRTEEKPRLMIAAESKSSKINTPLMISTPFPIKIEQNVPIVQEVGNLMPLMDLSTSSFPPLASQQGVVDMDLESEIGNVSNISPINTPQFSFDEDIRQIAYQLSRVATARPDAHDVLREIMFGTILAFGNGGFNDNVGEFFKKLSDRYNN